MKANVQVVAEMELYKQIFLFQLTGTVHFFTCLLMVPSLTGRGSTYLMFSSMDTQYLLKLRAGHSLSQAATHDIVMSTRSLFSDTGRLDMIKDKIINALCTMKFGSLRCFLNKCLIRPFLVLQKTGHMPH
jgi:hypothetical protein